MRSCLDQASIQLQPNCGLVLSANSTIMDFGENFYAFGKTSFCSKIRGQREIDSPMQGPWSFYQRFDRHGHICPIGPLPDLQPGLPGKILFPSLPGAIHVSNHIATG